MNTNVIEPTAAEGVGTEFQESDITSEKVYTFRKLQAEDVFPMFKLLSKIGINQFAESFGKESVQKMLTTLTAEGGMTNFAQTAGIAVMLEVANIVLANLANCKEEVIQILSGTSDLTVDQVRKLDLVPFTEMVIDFIKKDEFKDFIKVVSKLFK